MFMLNLKVMLLRIQWLSGLMEARAVHLCLVLSKRMVPSSLMTVSQLSNPTLTHGIRELTFFILNHLPMSVSQLEDLMTGTTLT